MHVYTLALNMFAEFMSHSYFASLKSLMISVSTDKLGAVLVDCLCIVCYLHYFLLFLFRLCSFLFGVVVFIVFSYYPARRQLGPLRPQYGLLSCQRHASAAQHSSSTAAVTTAAAAPTKAAAAAAAAAKQQHQQRQQQHQ